jgi:hypothetical protein
MTVCANCANPVEKNNKFCSYCSAPVDLTYTRTVDAGVAAAQTHSSMNLMPNESVLFESQGRSLILTTNRVRYQVETFGNSVIKSIMLEELASCAMVHSSNTLLLVLAGICLALGFLVAASGRQNEAGLVIGFILAVIFVIAYFASRRQVLALASAGTTILVNTQGMNVDAAKQFIEQTEAAKNARYLLGRR